MSNDFRTMLFPLDSPRLAMCRGMDPYTFGEAVQNVPLVGEMVAGWRARDAQPYHGVTCDGHKQPGLFPLKDEGAPVAAMTQAAQVLLAGLSDGERTKLCYPIDAPEWRRWSNPEFLVNPNGLRLEELSPQSREAVMAVVRASLSPAGYTKACGCMKTNAFLGQICDVPTIMNEGSYNFLLFGTPSESEPWGWNLYGHHLALNCFVVGLQMVISPTFMGAEPNVIDEGPDKGLTLFTDEEKIGLELIRSLSPDLRDKAIAYPQMNDPAMPESLKHPADQRHLGGAFQDNRIVPYEGVRAGALDAAQKDRLMALVAAFVDYLPPAPLKARLRQIEGQLDETRFSWIGGYGDEDPFYYRIQSPVVMIEFDHHSGVWLNNQEPAKCHIHTVVRTPNGNDYGKDLLRQHYEQVHPGHAPGQA